MYIICRPIQVFGFEVPANLPGVPAKVLNPREAWSDKEGYDATRVKLAGMFKDNFTKFVKVRAALARSGHGFPYIESLNFATAIFFFCGTFRTRSFKILGRRSTYIIRVLPLCKTNFPQGRGGARVDKREVDSPDNCHNYGHLVHIVFFIQSGYKRTVKHVPPTQYRKE